MPTTPTGHGRTNPDPNHWRVLWRHVKNSDGSTDTTLGRPAGAVAIALIAALIALLSGHPVQEFVGVVRALWNLVRVAIGAGL